MPKPPRNRPENDDRIDHSARPVPPVVVNYSPPKTVKKGDSFRPTIIVESTTSGAEYSVQIREKVDVEADAKLGSIVARFFKGDGKMLEIKDVEFAIVVGVGTLTSSVEITEITTSAPMDTTISLK